ncbi:MAG: Asp-tRNA(Asn)/Glu-tRNA(Gln) amidotransferase subunit GatC [bacterium]
MFISEQEVEKIAALAKLRFSKAEQARIAGQLRKIVSYVEKLDELDTEHVAPTHQVIDVKNVLRKDEVEPWLSQDEALQNAPQSKQGYFSVPKVIA